LVLGGLAGVTGGYFAYNGLASSESATGDSSATEPTQVQLVSGTTDEVVAAVAAVGLPSVVDVYVSGDGSANSSLPSTHPDVLVEGEGSGVAYKSAEDGGTYIITNQHVVDGATTITVTDAAGDTYDGEVVGEDTESDIAVIHVDAQIPVIEIGDSDALVVGELVVAIGSPYGFEQSVTSGVVSALHRSITDFGGDEGEYPYVDAIQTDAAINPGNSGGALLNSDAQLVGIPAAIYTETGSSAGVALAIPVNRATQVADQLIGGDAVDTPFLGVLGQTVTSDLATEEGLPVEEGAYVVEVTAGTEADKAGIQAGDVIVALDGDKIRSMDDLILKVRQRSVGDSVTVTLWRDGEKTTIDMTIGAKPAADTQG
jgi:putative serine protease PepD